MEGFEYGDSSQYQNSCKNLTVTLIELFVGFFFPSDSYFCVDFGTISYI